MNQKDFLKLIYCEKLKKKLVKFKKKKKGENKNKNENKN